jgi:hypothetical protein
MFGNRMSQMGTVALTFIGLKASKGYPAVLFD